MWYNIYEENTNTLMFNTAVDNIYLALRALNYFRSKPSNYHYRIVCSRDGKGYSFMADGDLG